MTNTKTTKRALFASVLSLLLCISMLVGSTFAWFTDSATTGVGSIVAGTLDIDLVDGEGNSLEGKTIGFVDMDDNDLWEPGCRYTLETIKLVNKGNLNAKYKVVISATTGDVDLANVIDVYEGETKLGTLRSFLDMTNGIKEGVIAPNTTLEFGTLTLVMQETAGNEYQGKSITDISITVLATQATVESDSKDNTYDEKAEYPFVWADKANVEAVNENTNEETKTVIIENAAQLAGLAQLVNEGTTFEGYTVTLENDIDLQNAEWTPIGNSTNKFKGNLNGQDHTVSNLNVSSEKGAQGLIGFAGGTVSVTNLTIDGASVDSTNGSAVGAFVGKADGAKITFNNLTLTGDVKLHAKSGQVGGILGNNPNGSVYASNITVSVDEGSYVSTEGNMGKYYDYVGGVFGQIWGATFENITSNIDVITDYGYGAGGISGGATGTWTNVSCSGNVTVLYTDNVVWYSNTNANGNSYGEVKWYQGVGTVIGYHGGVTYNNCTSTGALLYKDTGSTNNGMTWITSKSNGVAVQDNRFGCSRWKNDNTVTIND